MSAVLVPPPGISDTRAGPAVSIRTMGCKVNTFESELIQEQLDRQGYSRTDGAKANEICILNTCTVTAEADRQARQQVRRIIRENPDAWVVVTGCYAQTDPEACARIPGVDLVVGNARKLEIPALLDPLMRRELPPVMVDEIHNRDIGLPDHLVSGFEGRTRAFVQIQQGCDQGCTFCIIHSARGPNRSFSHELVCRQVQRLVLNGYREVVLCGVDIGSYGKDLSGDLELVDLLERLLELPDRFRLRLSSIDPAHISDRLISLINRNPDRICPHLHLSMQSGNTLILKRMKRRATRELLLERVGALRAAVSNVVLSADVLVGFPTEDENHFQDTLDVVDRLEIAFPHVFAYSRRPGTPAARIPRQVSAAEKKVRAQEVRRAGDLVRERVGSSLVGAKLPVLVEGRGRAKKDSFMGRADNYFGVRLSMMQAESDDWQEVEIARFEQGFLVARNAGERVQSPA